MGAEQPYPKLVGARVKRSEDPRFLMGRARYVDDLALPGMLHVAFVRSAMAHAELASVDVDHAKRTPGIRAVVTGSDIASRVRPIVCNSSLPSWQGTELPAMAFNRVRFAGEAIAAVAAESRYVAEDAVERIWVDYEPREVIASIGDAIRPGAALIHEDWQDNFFIKRHFSAGDSTSALADADGILEFDLVTHRQSGIPLETRGCIANYDESAETLVIWSSTQIPHLVRTGLADCLGLPEHRIRVIAPDVGGGFGIKASLYPEELVVAFLAVELSRPIKWIEDRREHLLASIHAREHHHKVQVAYNRNGVVTALRATVYVDCGAYSVFPWTATMDAGMALGNIPGPYRIRNYECDAFGVATNKSPLGAYRGIARPAACFSIERAMDQVARALGLDPLDVRRINLVRPDEFPYTSVTGLEFDSGSFIESVDTIQDVADYPRLRRLQQDARKEGRYLGIGVGCYTEQTAHTTAEFVKRGVPVVFGYDAATVRMDPSGKVTVHVSSHSHGQGHETTIAQVVGDQLSIPLEDVRIVFGDTAHTPYGMGTFGSRTAAVVGGAANRASQQIREKLLRFGAHLLETDMDDLELEAARIFVKGIPSRGFSTSELARYAYHRPEKLPPGMEPLLEASATYDAGPGTGTFSNAAHMGLVEVDPGTGRVKVLKYFVVEDCGQVINPMVVEGQVHGGVAQGIGGALLEELIYDPDGQLLSTTFLDYLLPGADDIPSIEVSHLETPSPNTIGGVKGMGEGGAIAPGPVIAGAVEDALAFLGPVLVNELPLTAERVQHFTSQASSNSQDQKK